MPYLMSLVVIGEPSSNFSPSLRVYVQVFEPSEGVPASVARSPTTIVLPVFGSIL